jgi:hypothetical protein
MWRRCAIVVFVACELTAVTLGAKDMQKEFVAPVWSKNWADE